MPPRIKKIGQWITDSRVNRQEFMIRYHEEKIKLLKELKDKPAFIPLVGQLALDGMAVGRAIKAEKEAKSEVKDVDNQNQQEQSKIDANG